MNSRFSMKVLVLASVMPMSCLAAFNIDYTDVKKMEPAPSQVVQTAKPASASPKLLLDNSVKWLFVDGKCEGNKVVGAASSVSLPNAIRLILPAGWRVFADEGTVLDGVVMSWQSGDEWMSIIGAAAEKYRFRTEVNCAEKTVTFHPSPNRGIYAEREEVDFGDVQPSQNIPASSSVTTPAIHSTQSVITNESAEPLGRETINSYAERFAVANNYDRVAYKIKSGISKVISKEISTKKNKNFSFDESLAEQNLYRVNGIDAVTGANIMVIADTEYAAGSSLLVFGVSKGMLSQNAGKLAKIHGKEIDELNSLMSDEDYQIPFGYDIVGVTAIDMFAELFAPFPVQAQFVTGQKTISIVKRDTANREH